MVYESHEPEQLILRDHLAIDRTRLANERTFLAYIRTAMMLLLAGGTVIKFFGDSDLAVVSGWGLVVLGLVVALFGIGRFVAMRGRIDRSGRPNSIDRTAATDPN